MDRERELAELAAYVRTLADRMGLKDWTFRVEWTDADDFDVFLSWWEDRREALLIANVSSFGETREERRVALVRELLHCHFPRPAILDSAAAYDFTMALGRIAKSWAVALPLPLVGLMRRAAPALAREED